LDPGPPPTSSNPLPQQLAKGIGCYEPTELQDASITRARQVSTRAASLIGVGLGLGEPLPLSTVTAALVEKTTPTTKR
jgi:hypothetical protein